MYVLVGDNNTAEKYPFTVQELRRRHRNVSFPVPIPEETLNSFGVYSVATTPRPLFDSLTSTMRTIAVCNDEGVWEQAHTVVRLSEEQTKENVKSRARDELAETNDDLMFYLEQNLPIPEDLVAFRNYMREIESQEGYPYDLDWPTKPSR